MCRHTEWWRRSELRWDWCFSSWQFEFTRVLQEAKSCWKQTAAKTAADDNKQLWFCPWWNTGSLSRVNVECTRINQLWIHNTVEAPEYLILVKRLVHISEHLCKKKPACLATSKWKSQKQRREYIFPPSGLFNGKCLMWRPTGADSEHYSESSYFNRPPDTFCKAAHSFKIFLVNVCHQWWERFWWCNIMSLVILQPFEYVWWNLSFKWWEIKFRGSERSSSILAWRLYYATSELLCNCIFRRLCRVIMRPQSIMVR